MVRYASGSGEFQNLIVFLVVLVADREDTDIAQYFDECLDFIDEAKGLGGGVLVHCFVGRSRSLISPPRQTGLVVVCEHLTWVVSAQETHKVRGKTQKPAAVLPLLQ
ncbi:hypothetical protein NE237_013291 [Protea cynaroides]|uniref:Dual specificity phosphatase catalytic domain-containing protein n=1 Tax=Protea cynaroides TaxID=273540 RepID=A0A9Q0K017_9MAGN|nr:hypothetical protein NE237_013291 [Protea cynaroides]